MKGKNLSIKRRSMKTKLLTAAGIAAISMLFTAPYANARDSFSISYSSGPAFGYGHNYGFQPSYHYEEHTYYAPAHSYYHRWHHRKPKCYARNNWHNNGYHNGYRHHRWR